MVGAVTTATSMYYLGQIQYRKTGLFSYALVGAFIGEAIAVYTVLYNDTPDPDWDPKTGFYSGLLPMIFAFIAFSWSKKYASAPRRGLKGTYCGSLKRCGKTAFAVFAFWALLGVGCYHNVSVTNDDGEEHRIKDSFDEIYNSPVWAQLGETVKGFYNKLQNDVRILRPPTGTFHWHPSPSVHPAPCTLALQCTPHPAP